LVSRHSVGLLIPLAPLLMRVSRILQEAEEQQVGLMDHCK
jgi:hypothetical protein